MLDSILFTHPARLRKGARRRAGHRIAGVGPSSAEVIVGLRNGNQLGVALSRYISSYIPETSI